jgi:hypothetical protein
MEQPEGVEDLDSVDRVVEYQTSYADFSAILNRASHMEVRVHYLKNLRDDWKMVDYYENKRHRSGHVLFKRK